MKIFKNFKEKKSFKPEFGAEGIFGGHLLGVTSSNSLGFYDWESVELIRRIEISVKHVHSLAHSLTLSPPHFLPHRSTGTTAENWLVWLPTSPTTFFVTMPTQSRRRRRRIRE